MRAQCKDSPIVRPLHGLWAMALNTGWVPVKARGLQNSEKLKKYVPIHKGMFTM